MIEEQPLNQNSTMHRSLAGNPTIDRVRGGSVNDRVLKLSDVRDIEIRLSPATVDQATLQPIPATAIFTYPHNVKGQIPIVEWYETDKDMLLTVFLASVTQPEVDENNFYLSYVNYEQNGLDIKIRVYIYELLTV